MQDVAPYIWAPVALIILFVFKILTRKRFLPLPPGPKPSLLFGNLFDIPTIREEVAYARWGKEYGDISHVSVLGRHIIVLNSVTTANDLLDERSNIYSDRPYLPMIHEPNLMNADFLFGVSRYGDTWKRHRRIFTHHVNPGAVTHVFSVEQIRATHTLLRQLLVNPKDLRGHLFHASASTLLGIAYGYEVQPKDDPFARLSMEVITAVSEGLAPKFMVNIFPILRHIPSWIPGGSFKRFATRTKFFIKELIDKPYEWLKEETALGKAHPSFMQSALNDIADAHDSRSLDDVKKVAATMYGAGVDTTLVTIHAFILQIVLNPNIQCRAQAELDSVIGSPDSPSFRLPTFTDRPKLPYIDALMKEALRWNPALPLGVPHASIQDDEYLGWKIPKGAIIFANAWGMLRDERVYSDPYTFQPERFLGTRTKPSESDPSVSGVFGFGRRMCPGRLVAETSIWLQIANLLACFDFAPMKDSNGNDIDVSFALTPLPSFVLEGPTFPCSITPRSKYVEEVVRETESYNIS